MRSGASGSPSDGRQAPREGAGAPTRRADIPAADSPLANVAHPPARSYTANATSTASVRSPRESGVGKGFVRRRAVGSPRPTVGLMAFPRRSDDQRVPPSMRPSGRASHRAHERKKDVNGQGAPCGVRLRAVGVCDPWSVRLQEYGARTQPGARRAPPPRQLPEPGERRALRERVGVSQAAVAESIGVCRPSISRYETGSSTPRGEALVRYLDVLALLAAEAASAPEMPDAASGRRQAEATDATCHDGL